MFAAGSVNGVHNLAAVVEDGRRAGWEAARDAGYAAGRKPSVRSPRGAAGVNHPWPIFSHPNGKDFVDFDEDIQVCDIVNAVAEGFDDIELVKRFSTLGMGPSQGRHSALSGARLAARALGRPIGETGTTTSRPPVAAEKFGHLAGRSFEPVRRTPMHWRHLGHGATMMTAGPWLRPEFYGPPETRAANIRAASPGVDASHEPTIEIFATSLSMTPRRANPSASQRRTSSRAPLRNSSSGMNVIRP